MDDLTNDECYIEFPYEDSLSNSEQQYSDNDDFINQYDFPTESWTEYLFHVFNLDFS